jgi:hypothetical protein
MKWRDGKEGGRRERERENEYTSSIALIRFWVDLLISPPAGGIPLPGVKKAVLGPGWPFISTV